MKKILNYFIVFVFLFNSFTPAVQAQIDLNSERPSSSSGSTVSEAELLDLQNNFNNKNLVQDLSMNSLAANKESNSSAMVRKQKSIRAFAKKSFRADEAVQVIVDNADARELSTKVFNTSGEEVSIQIDEISDTNPAVFRIKPVFRLKPGRYRVLITDSAGQKLIQDFLWGVLAINTNKSIYTANEQSKISIAVLDETGMMVCDAHVNLEILDPSGNSNNLSTSDGRIRVNPECLLKQYTSVPDYETEFQIGSLGGVYTMNLTAVTSNGIYTINDSFEVREGVEFDVERTTATRIYPPEKYSVVMEITANNDFQGVITDIAPAGFQILPLDGAVSYSRVTEISAKDALENVLSENDFNIGLPYKGEHVLTQGFGSIDKDPLLKEKYNKYGVIGHDGVDFDLAMGTEVVAVDDGVIGRARENYDYGTTVIIEHKWGKSYYGHLSKMMVKEGDKVKRGDVIALSGNTGLSTAPHLHFGIKLNKSDFNNGYYGKVNPLSYLHGFEEEKLDNPTSISRANANVKGQLISWDVSMKKGDRIRIGYSYLAPTESPQFYLLGPLEFRESNKLGGDISTDQIISMNLVFREARQWQIAVDSVTGDYTTFWGSSGAAGTTQFATLSGTTEGAALSGDAASASNIGMLKAIHAPTRDEELIGHIKEDGRLDIITCTGLCDAATDDTLQFNKTIDAAQACDTTFGSCWRQFDIAYEQLSGDAMVAFIDPASDGTIQYCTYNGSAWTPSSCTSPSSYSFNGGSSVDGRWVRLISRGEGMKTTRTDEILLVVSDANSDIFAAIWDGSTWSNLTTITSSASTPEIQNFDGAWEETTGNALVVWAEGTSTTTTPFQYKRWIRGTTTWDSSGTNMTITGSHIGHWVTMKGAPIAGKDHIAIITQSATTMGNNCSTGSNCAAQPWIWTGGGSPTMTKGNECTTTEPTHQRSTDVAVESVNVGAVHAFYVCAIQSTLDGDRYETWVEGTGFSAVTAMDGTTADAGDDPEGFQITGHYNSNEVQITLEDVDADCNHHNWSGTAMLAAGWDTAACSSAGVTTLAPTSHTVEPNEGTAFWVSATPYSAWSKNWRWYDGTDSSATPTTALAAENTTPQVGNTNGEDFRLRVNVAELASGPNSANARKKLQYVSEVTCPNPDSCVNTNWTDVDDPAGAGIWRYVTGLCAASNCTDGDLLDGTVLTTTEGTCTAGNGCGTWVLDKDAAGGANMDHNSAIVQEIEYDIENNGAASDTTYYFRLFDVDDNTSIFRQQNASVCGPSQTSACTYPSLDTTDPPPGPTLEQAMRHGSWFSNGVEQPFYY